MQALFGAGLIAFANAGPDDERRLEPLIDDLMTFPWSDQSDAVIALWVANGHATFFQGDLPSLSVMQDKRGLPMAARRP